MGNPPITKRYSLAEYLELEEAVEYKNEFYNGDIYTMSGGTPTHSRITVDCMYGNGRCFQTQRLRSVR